MNKKSQCNKSLWYTVLLLTVIAGQTGCSRSASSTASASNKNAQAPATVFDLSAWSITVPVDDNQDGKADAYNPQQLQTYYHPHFYYLNNDNQMVFVSPNKATTSPNSTNTRSELRQEFVRNNGPTEGLDKRKNYFSLATHPEADQFAAVGGRLDATLQVDHVSMNAGYPEKGPAYSVVVGQIHAAKLDKVRNDIAGFGWGNEPLKIFYKKFPDHETGSVFWAYERNLPKDDPHRTDIIYPVWGNHWDVSDDPRQAGIALSEPFSYTVEVVGNTMHLIFTADGHPDVRHQINLANNLDRFGQPDKYDDPQGYQHDWLFFKAGAYNQCSTTDAPTFRYPACPGIGIWAQDKANGNYAQVTFHSLSLSNAQSGIAE